MSENERKERTMYEISRDCFDSSIRVERAFHTAFQADQYSDEVKEMLEDLDDAEKFNALLHHAHPGAVIMRAEDDPYEMDQDDIGELFSRMVRQKVNGFFAKASTPVPTDVAKDKRSWSSCGFGYYRLQWFFTERFDDAFFERLKEWQQSVVDDVWRAQHKDAGETTKAE
jgi:hypothetical protein